MSMPGTDRSSSKESCERGIAFLRRGHVEDAFRHLSDAYLRDSHNPAVQSAYALALALAKHELAHALRLAREAVQQDPYNPDLYYHLAEIYLANGSKRQAIRSLRRVLVLDPEHPLTRKRLTSLGERCQPVLRFLKRERPINRFLGQLRAGFR